MFVSVHGEQTQSCLLKKTHQSNGNLHKNDSVLMPKGEFKLALNPNRPGPVRPEKNPNFSKMAKIVISVKNPKFILWISDDQTDFAIGIISQNLATTSNFVEFRDSRNLHVFRDIEFRVPENDLKCDKSHI